jgi:hypothetical protein
MTTEKTPPTSRIYRFYRKKGGGGEGDNMSIREIRAIEGDRREQVSSREKVEQMMVGK